MKLRATASSLYRRSRIPYLMTRSQGIGLEQARLACHYFNDRLVSPSSDDRHLEESMQWLCRAQDACNGKGVSAVYDLNAGWQVAYPETSGYIIATYLAFADMSGDKSYIDRAIQLGEWEVDIQAANGGILSHPDRTVTRVFNTGQVILGWCALYEAINKQSYLDAACRAGKYLIALQENDGSWIRDTYCGARTYHARVDWALLRLALLSGNDEYATTAVNNLSWVLRQQRDNGWFANCGFNSDDPIMHVIIYTLRGLLESHLAGGKYIRDLNILPRVVKAADALCNAIRTNPVRRISCMAPASFDEHWSSRDRNSCLTGNVQLAAFLIRLAHTTGNDEYRTIAQQVLEATKQTQVLDTSLLQIRGALPGSYPFYDGYHPLSFPNWATKFMADALLMKLGFERKLAVKA